MQFLHSEDKDLELTFDDIFLVQNYFEGRSRFDINLKPDTPLSTTLPIISANMNAVTGKRMAETLARFWGLGTLSQDMSINTIERIIKEIKQADTLYETPITLKRENTVRDALWVIDKRSHGCVILIDENHKPISIYTKKDLEKYDQFTVFSNIKKWILVIGKYGIKAKEAFNLMNEKWVSSLPIVDKDGVLKGIFTKNNTIRSEIYTPSLWADKKLDASIVIGINEWLDKIDLWKSLWIDTFVIDTAHGFQKKMIEQIKKIRKNFSKDLKIIAGNVCTKKGTRALIEAWANGVKVGIWPGAMCTTRIKTGVWRPQFSAVYECSKEAQKLEWFTIADGGIKNPRDLCFALAGWASYVMMGTILTGTHESVADIKYDADGKAYKMNYGMASKKAVSMRNEMEDEFFQAKKSLFKEGISTSKIYLKEWRDSVGKIVDEFMMWLRSAMTYVGVNNLHDFHKNSIIWVQTNSGYEEGTPHGGIKK